MAVACPHCKQHGQVRDRPEFWRSLSQDSELKAKYAPPPRYVVQWLLPLGGVAAGAVVIASGGLILGLLAVAGGGGTAAWMGTKASTAEAARARWARLRYCRRRPRTFPPEQGLALGGGEAAVEDGGGA